MKRAIAAAALCLASCLASPLAAAETGEMQSILEYSVERDGAVLMEGRAYPTTGTSYEETIGQAYPPACSRGEVESGYRNTFIYFSHPNFPSSQFSVFLRMKETRNDIDDDDDPCAGKRAPELNFSNGFSFTLEVGETRDLDMGESVVIRVRRADHAPPVATPQ